MPSLRSLISVLFGGVLLTPCAVLFLSTIAMAEEFCANGFEEDRRLAETLEDEVRVPDQLLGGDGGLSVWAIPRKSSRQHDTRIPDGQTNFVFPVQFSPSPAVTRDPHDWRLIVSATSSGLPSQLILRRDDYQESLASPRPALESEYYGLVQSDGPRRSQQVHEPSLGFLAPYTVLRGTAFDPVFVDQLRRDEHGPWIGWIREARLLRTVCRERSKNGAAETELSVSATLSSRSRNAIFVEFMIPSRHSRWGETGVVAASSELIVPNIEGRPDEIFTWVTSDAGHRIEVWTAAGIHHLFQLERNAMNVIEPAPTAPLPQVFGGSTSTITRLPLYEPPAAINYHIISSDRVRVAGKPGIAFARIRR